MSYLYNLFAGSLDDLRARLDAVDLADPVAVKRAVKQHDPFTYDLLDLDDEEVEDGAEGPMVVSAVIESTWIASPHELLNWLDWHEEDTFLQASAARLPGEAGDLLGSLFQAPPLDVDPLDWGFRGSLRHAEVTALRDALSVVLPPATIDGATARSGYDWHAAGDDVDVPLAWVYLSLAAVPDGRDVAVRLG